MDSRIVPPAPMRGSNGVAFGPDGRLYVAQFLSGLISAVDLASGDLEVVAGTDSPVRSPDDLAFGADGSMYITDLVPGRVWRRAPDGEYALVSDDVALPNGIACAGDRLFVNEMRMGGRLLELFPGGGEPVVLADGLAMGNAMQLGPDGFLYYPHMMTGEVFRVPPDGGPAELVADGVHEPVAVRFDRGGALLVLSRGRAGIVTRIDAGRRSIVETGIAGLDNAAFDDENRMFVSSFAGGGIAEVHPDGRSREVVPRGLAGPFGVTVDLAGTVSAADHYRVTRVGDTGVTMREMLVFSHGIAADGPLLHVTSQYGDVRTYDPATGTVRTRATGLAQPMGLAVGDGRLVVAESGAGRVVAIDADDVLTVLAEGLSRPVDVAAADGTWYVSDEAAGAVLRLPEALPVAAGLQAPQGIAVRGNELFVVEAGAGRLTAVGLGTGETRVEVEDLAVLPPAGEPLFAHGMPGLPGRFAGVAAAPDGTLYVAANGEGTVVRVPSGR
ncbi:outer membrane protein assembly factor BamB family protein [Amycolatopsis thermoflava]|uniref:outer membrane protein assembly factor BamB family protein n=1 Tax=Amycolatopsis thermoflava TaxID=84480 RepID=UPI003650A801